jgi:hypothetical protein
MSYLLSVRLMGVPNGSGRPSEWLNVIWAINADYRERHGADVQYIGEPVRSYPQSGNRWFEEYPEFRVILMNESTNYVQATTPEAVEYLRRAVEKVTGRTVDANGMTV